jgi:hypothetical protein
MQVGNTSLVDDAPWRGQLDDNGATVSAAEAAEAEAAFAQHVRAELSMTESQVCQQPTSFEKPFYVAKVCPHLSHRRLLCSLVRPAARGWAQGDLPP